MEVTGRREKRCKQLLVDLKEMTGYWKLREKCTESQSVENSIWKRLWTCRKTDYEMND